MNSVVQVLIRFFLRWTPDSFVVAGLLSLLTFVLAMTVGGFGLTATMEAWGDSFWNLLAFTNQITLTLLLGYAFAHTPPIRALLMQLAALATTPTRAYMLACVVSGTCALFSWGLSLIAAGIMSR